MSNDVDLMSPAAHPYPRARRSIVDRGEGVVTSEKRFAAKKQIARYDVVTARTTRKLKTVITRVPRGIVVILIRS